MSELGFTVNYPHFQRKRDGRLELVSLVHEKWGGGMFLEFATIGAGDLQTSWGDVVPEQKIEVAYTDPATRARLIAKANGTDSRESYFRYDTLAENQTQCDELLQSLIDLLPQVIGWFEHGKVGPNIVPFSRSLNTPLG